MVFKQKWRLISSKTGLIFSLFLFLSFSVYANEKYDLNHRPPQEQVDQYNKKKRKSVIELQQFRTQSSIKIRTQKGKQGKATLTNLNPFVNTWYLLTLKWNKVSRPDIFHLENPFPTDNTFILDPDFPSGTVIETKDKHQYQCDLWASYPKGELDNARKNAIPFAALCDNRLYLRNKTKGRKTTLESATDFLRRYVPAGEKITKFVRETLYQDKYAKTSEITKDKELAGHDKQQPKHNVPLLPLIDPKYKDSYLIPEGLGIPLENGRQKKMVCGKWYHVKNSPGIFVSAIQPKMVSQDVVKKQKGLVKRLDSIEKSALAYLVAFDLDEYDFDFALGTEHPSVEWADGIRHSMRNSRLPGPDGIGSVKPLVNTGIVRPDKAKRIAATFTGGFKRYHGAFRRGPLGKKNNASHYGFIEHGVVMSKLQPDLATVIIFTDGIITLKTWQEQDNILLPLVRHVRQNGVPVIHDDLPEGPRPSIYVMKSLFGNWSGSADGKYRTLRACIALQEYADKRFLIYGYFSSSTPSAIARVLQAYHCTYAMPTDMNALEHTYLAVY
ncbi:MAG: hypothetical protein GY795_00915, partial [Desulfobacterales bacterium]|nr:hypothetical protein [Desulfobacterales bacterium]